MKHRFPWWVQIAIGIPFALVSLQMVRLLARLLEPNTLQALVLCAALASWLFGFVCCATVTVILAATAWYVLFPPVHAWAFDQWNLVYRICFFVLASLTVGWLIETVKKTSEALRKSQDRIAELLEREREARARAESLAEETQRTNQELDQFAYVVSHDLQEPLRAVGTFTQMLSRHYGDRLDAEAAEFVEIIESGVVRMRNMIQDLLLYSRTVNRPEAGSRGIAGQEALEAALANLAGAIDSSGAVITQDELPDIALDRVPAVQLFQNLVGNAIKYRDSRRCPVIHVGVSNQDGLWKFSVSDNGIGIDPRQQERIWGVFRRLHGDRYPGTGIGLALAKKIVERHGGRIWVESEPGKGSTFCFTLPGLHQAAPGEQDPR
jgi:light-regulated signal transduction histidine kinase (bacteriophytochrome)